MQKIVVIFLLILLSLPSLVKVGVIANWQLHREEITNLFCVNKAEPEKHCNGKCYLKTQIQAVDQQKTENSATGIEFLSVDFSPYIPTQFMKVGATFFHVKEAAKTPYQERLHSFSYFISNLHPPELL